MEKIYRIDESDIVDYKWLFRLVLKILVPLILLFFGLAFFFQEMIVVTMFSIFGLIASTSLIKSLETKEVVKASWVAKVDEEKISVRFLKRMGPYDLEPDGCIIYWENVGLNKIMGDLILYDKSQKTLGVNLFQNAAIIPNELAAGDELVNLIKEKIEANKV